MRRKIVMVSFVALASLFVFASGVKADTIQKINVSADNKISSLLPTTVYKNPGNTYIGIGRCSTYGDDITRYLAKFDTSSLDKTKDIKSAIFKIDRVSQTWDNDAPTPYNLHHITSAYDSSTVHWSTSPFYDATQAVLGVKKDYGIFDFDITNSVKEWINGTTTDHSILIKKQDEEAIKFPAYTCVYGSFASTDYSSSGAETRPYLEVTYYDPSITVLSPNGGETYKTGDTLTFKWNAVNPPEGKVVTINLLNENNPETYQINVSQGYCELSGGCISITQGYYQYIVPASVPAGKYRAEVRCWDKNSEGSSCSAFDRSDAPFSIVAAGVNLPDLVISDFTWTPISPKSGENITANVKVKNIGLSSAQNFSVTNLWDGNYKEINISNLAPGGETTVQGNIGGLSSPGANNMSMMVDTPSKVVESNENNNSLAKTITVSPNYSGDGTFTLKHWETLQLNNGYILYADGENILGQTPYKVRFKLYTPSTTSNYQVVATSIDLSIGSSFLFSSQGVSVEVNAINVSSPGNANWSVNLTASSKSDTTPSITVLYPNGGEEIYEGTTQKIVWSAKNFSGLNVSIDLIDTTGYVTSIASNISNTGYYYWNTAAGVKGGYLSGYSYKIRISSNDRGPSAVDDSNSYFRIIPATTEIIIPSIAVLSPNGGETMVIGNSYDVKFRATQKGSAYIQLLKEDKFVGYIHDYIGSPYDIIGQQVYKWKVPSSSIPGNDYKIRVMKPGPSGSVGENIIDDSDAPFSIVATEASALKVDLKINNSDNPTPIVYNSKFTASWSSSGASYCTGYGIDVITENGGVWISGKYPASGSKTLYAKSASGSIPFSTFHLGLQCWDDFGKSVVDLIENIPTVLPITGVTTIKEGSIVKIQGVPDVYVIKDGQKVKINSPQEFEQKGYKWDQIQIVQADLLAQIAELKAQVKQLKEDLAKAGALLKSMTGPDVYVIVDGKKEKIQDPETFNKRGYKWNQIQSVSQEDLESIPEYTPSAQQTATAPALPQGIIPGSLVKSPNSPAVYYITPTGAKKHILNSKVFNSYNNKWDNVRTVSQDEINASPTVNVFRIGNESKVYFISDGQKQWVKTPEAFTKKGLKWDQIVSVNKTEIDEYKEGEEIE